MNKAHDKLPWNSHQKWLKIQFLVLPQPHDNLTRNQNSLQTQIWPLKICPLEILWSWSPIKLGVNKLLTSVTPTGVPVTGGENNIPTSMGDVTRRKYLQKKYK